MRDLVHLLDEAAGGQPSDLPDIDSIQRRARPRILRRRLSVVAAGVVVAIAGWSGVRAADLDLLGRDQPVVAPGQSSPCSDPRTPDEGVQTVHRAEQLRLGGPAGNTVFGFGAAWVQVGQPVDQVVKVDQGSGRVALAVDDASGVAIAADAVWLLVGASELIKIDPDTCARMLTIQTTNNDSYLDVGLGSVWVPSGTRLLRFDEQTGRLLAAIDVGVQLNDVHVADDAVWVTAGNADTVVRIDPDTDTVIAEIAVCEQPEQLAIDERGVWVTCIGYTTGATALGTVAVIDPDTDEIRTLIDDIGSTGGLTAGGGYVWVCTGGVGITRIDPQTYEQVIVLGLSEWNLAVAYGEDELWVSGRDGGWVYRVPLPAY